MGREGQKSMTVAKKAKEKTLKELGIWVGGFSGRVVAQQKWAETYISGDGGGGGGYIDPGTGGYIDPVTVNISSDVSENLEFFLKNKDVEKRFRIRNSKVGLREGHVVTVWWAGKRGNNNSSLIFVFNHTTKERSELGGIYDISRLPGSTDKSPQNGWLKLLANLVIVSTIIFGGIPGLLILSYTACRHDRSGDCGFTGTSGEIMFSSWAALILLSVIARIVVGYMIRTKAESAARATSEYEATRLRVLRAFLNKESQRAMEFVPSHAR